MISAESRPKAGPTVAEEPINARAGRGRRGWVGPLVLLGFLAALGGLAYRYPDRAKGVYGRVVGYLTGPNAHVAEAPAPDARRAEPKGPWDGSITLGDGSRAAMGLVATEVKPQTEPIRLEILGTTENITDTLTKIRPMFRGRVDKVHVELNQKVKRGDPLIDLYSKDLAEAKSVYEIEKIQWIHDKKLSETREQLLKTNNVSQIVYEETRNSEMKSHKEFEVARDKLQVFGLTDAEVDRIEAEPASEKARMTLRSPTDGFVIGRDVGKGNLYDENDTLLTIAPLDRLWVWGNVFVSDLDVVKVGQSWEIQFPFMADKVMGKVEYISTRVDPSSHAVRVRTSIPNPDARLKSDMQARGALEIPPIPGRTVIPRTALIVDDGQYYAFVQAPEDPNRFERRVVDVAQEKDDHAVISSGLKPGERVASVGALLLAQVYDELKESATIASAAPATPRSDSPTSAHDPSTADD